MKTTERFSNRVENYVKYRPDYPKEILEVFRRKMNLQNDSVIADIGAGTGISAKIFLENGNTVFGVEPNQAMREAAKVFLKDFEKFQAVNGTAENTSLENKSVDFIAAAQAFHWFKGAETRKEFKRILRDKGFVALIWNQRQLDSTDFLREYENFLHRFATDYNEIRHEHTTEKVIRDFFQKDFQTAVFQNSQTFNFEELKGRLLSSSYTPTENHPRFEEMLKELERLFTKHAESGKIEILYDTIIYYERL